jgi:hypothetical protein
MNIFIDRFTDLLLSKQVLGRRLRGCNFAFLSTGNGADPDATLNQAFSNFCDYLGIEDLGMVCIREDGPLYEQHSVLNIRTYIRNGTKTPRNRPEP